MNSPQSSRSASRFRWLCLSATAAFSTVICLPLLSYPYNFDQAVFSTVADTMARGGVMYRDAWDLKPPAIYATYYLARLVFGPTMWGIRVLEILAVTSSAVGLVIVGRKWFSSWLVGWVAGCFLPLSYMGFACLSQANTAQAETFQMALLVGILIVWPSREERGSLSCRCWLAGALAGGLLLFKYTAFFVPLVLVLDRGLMDRREQQPKNRWFPVGMTCAGILTPIAIVAGWAIFRGIFGDLVEIFAYARQYVRLDAPPSASMALRRFVESCRMYGPPWVAGLLALGLVRGGTCGRGAFVRWAVLAASSLVCVWVQLKLLPYHLILLLPAIALGLGMVFLPFPQPRAGRHAYLSMAGAGVLLAGIHLGVWIYPYWSFAAKPAGPDGAQNVAELVRERSHRDEKILVWGDEPILYCLSARRLAGRYTHLTLALPPWNSSERLEAFLSRLLEDAPRVVVVCSRDSRWGFSDGARRLQETPEMIRILQECYTAPDIIGRYQIWTRREGAP